MAKDHCFVDIEEVVVGEYAIQTWFKSYFPSQSPILYMCRHCLDYHEHFTDFKIHQQQCTKSVGSLIYTEESLNIHEIDGAKDKLFCQNISLLSKLFLDQKTIYFDVSPFLFYVLSRGCGPSFQILGYFSKEKYSAERYNLSCILVLPPFQKQGLGMKLIEFSYELSKRNGVGGPERPLSQYGFKSYFSFWRKVLICTLLENPDRIMTIAELGAATGIEPSDILLTFSEMGILDSWNNKMLNIDVNRLKKYALMHNLDFNRSVNPSLIKQKN